jgi:site-specific DNA-cytosine methylase
MSKPTFTSLFSGCGGADLGAIAAGFEHCQALEYDPQIAELFKANIGDCFTQNILDSNPSKFERPDVLHASPVCFVKDTLVLTSEKLTPIQDVKIGDFVVTHKGRLRKVTNVVSRKSNVVEVKGQGHYGLITTHDHPFLSITKKRIYPSGKERCKGNYGKQTHTPPSWAPASTLKGKHWLSLTQYPSQKIPEITFLGNESLRGQEFEFTPEFFKVIGLWIGNGWIRYSNGDTNLTNRGEVIICANKKKARLMRDDLIAAKMVFYESDVRTCSRFHICSKPLCRWLITNFGRMAHGKVIPTWLLGCDDLIRRSFFDGYMATDGHIFTQKGQTIQTFRATTVSQKLAFGMRMVGLSLGYSSSLSKQIPPAQKIIEGRTINQSPIYILAFMITERSSITTGIYKSGCVRFVTECQDAQDVYCITVEEDESFIADGIVVHNCKSYSTANTNKGEKQLDIDCALKVCEFLEVLQPPTFTLENVEAYRYTHRNGKITAFGHILEKLYSLGYWVNYQVLNAADFGVPQSRRRLILIAVKSGFIPSLPLPEKHIGWYEAIADLVYGLPDGKLADWQLRALPNKIKESLLLSGTYVSHSNKIPDMRSPNTPCFTQTATIYKHPTRCVLVENTGARSDRPLQTKQANEPCWTLKALGQDGHWHKANALLENASIKALDIACLARLQSFPDDYKWSGKKSLDGKGIGNSVPPLMYQKILQSVYQCRGDRQMSKSRVYQSSESKITR